RHRALGIGAAFQRGRWFDLQVQSGRNPLYRDGDETRITFRFGSLFGRAAVVRAADTVGGTDGAAQSIPPFRGARAAAMIGGAVVGVALASSSGSDRRDSAPRMTTRDVAARSIVGAVNPRSVRENREYGGWLYRNADGTYGHTGPI